MRISRPALVGGIAVLGLLAACSSTTSQTSSSATTPESGPASTSSSSAEASAAAAVNPKALACDVETPVSDLAAYPVPKASKPYKVTLLEATSSGYYFQSLAEGAKQAAEEAGIELTVIAGSGFSSPAEQLQQAENALQAGAEAILLQPSDYKGSAAVVDAVQAAGIPIVDIASEVDSPIHQVVQDDYLYGQVLADQVALAVGDAGGKGVFMAGPATATWATKRAEGFADRVAEMYPQLEVVASPTTDVDPGQGLTAFENAAQANPDLAWVSSVYEYILPSKAIPSPYSGQIKYVAGSYEPSVIEGLNADLVYSAVSTEPIGVGRIGVATIVDLLDGGDPPLTHCVAAQVYTKADVGSDLANFELLPADRK